MSEYILSIKSAEVTADIQRAIDNPPQIQAGYGARLKTDLTWELYEFPPKPSDDKLTAEDALSIITGGVT